MTKSIYGCEKILYIIQWERHLVNNKYGEVSLQTPQPIAEASPKLHTPQSPQTAPPPTN